MLHTRGERGREYPGMRRREDTESGSTTPPGSTIETLPLQPPPPLSERLVSLRLTFWPAVAVRPADHRRPPGVDGGTEAVTGMPIGRD